MGATSSIYSHIINLLKMKWYFYDYLFKQNND
jgi:hypothetical protein